MADNNKYNFGVIGVGYRFPLVMKAHQPENDCYLIAAADPAESSRQRFISEMPAPVNVYETAEEMIAKEDLQAVFILSPDWLHKEHALLALNAGLDIFLEKPMATTVEDCDLILETARKLNRKIYVGHNMRHMHFVQEIKKLIDSNVIGQVKTVWCRHFVGFGGDCYFKDWHAERRYTNGLLIQKGSHDLDVINWICNGTPLLVTGMGQLSVYCDVDDIDPSPVPGKQDRSLENWPPLAMKGRNPVVDVEDMSMMFMQLDNGIMVSYQQCHFTPDNWRNLTIIGTKGRIENFGDRGEEGAVIKIWNQKCHYNGEADQTIEVSPDNREGDRKMIEEFIEYLKEGKQPITSPIDARNSVAAGALATESIRSGSMPQHVPKLSEDVIKYFSKKQLIL